jgi:hypothetical protein
MDYIGSVQSRAGRYAYLRGQQFDQDDAGRKDREGNHFAGRILLECSERRRNNR